MRPFIPRIISALLLVQLFASTGCKVFLWSFSTDSELSHAELAADYAEQGDIEKAVEEYLLHIDTRLANPKRPKDENPHFYRLLIGDLYLKKGDRKQAQVEYLIARDNDVDRALVVDRLRQLTRSYGEAGDFETAIQLSEEYREMEPLAFDADIDEYHKKQIGKADSSN